MYDQLGFRRCAWLAPAFVLALFLSAPFGFVRGCVFGGNPAGSPLPTIFALGLITGLYIDGAYSSVYSHFRGSTEIRTVLLSLSAIALLITGLLDWVSVSFFEEAYQSRGFFGTDAFVSMMGLSYLANPILALTAGLLSPLWLKRNVGAFDMKTLDTPYRVKVISRLSFGAMSFTFGLLLRMVLAAAYVSARSVRVSALCVLAIVWAAIACWSFHIARAERGMSNREATGYSRLALFCFAHGILTWGLLIRVIRIDVLSSSAFISIGTVALVALSLLFSWSLSACKNGAWGGVGDVPDNFIDSILTKGGLAPRELEIARLFARGVSSGSIADELGIKPATVRSALQRSYKKLGVARKEEFLSLFESESAGVADTARFQKRCPLTMDWLFLRTRRWMVLACIFAGVCIAPTVVGASEWGAFRPWLYGVGAFCMLLGATAAILFDKWSPACSEVFPSAHMLLPAFLGIAWEETLRLATPYALGDVAWPYLSALIVAAALLIRHRYGRMSVSVHLKMRYCSLAVCILILGLLWRPALFFVALVSACVLFHELWACKLVDASQIALCLFIYGLFAIAGDVLVNKCGDMLFGNDWYTSFFGGRGAFTMLCFVLTFAMNAVAVIYCAVAVRLVFAHEDAKAMHALDLEVDGRIWHYCLSRGLNEMQTGVLLLIAKGRSSRQIANELGYSYGSINGARYSGYRRLGVHDRLDLMRAFAQLNEM